jgi:hypothetical protein
MSGCQPSIQMCLAESAGATNTSSAECIWNIIQKAKKFGTFNAGQAWFEWF